VAEIDKYPSYIFENLPGEEKYRFAVLKGLETFEGIVTHACNRKDEAALTAIQSEVGSILRTAAECIKIGIPYVREEE